MQSAYGGLAALGCRPQHQFLSGLQEYAEEKAQGSVPRRDLLLYLDSAKRPHLAAAQQSLARGGGGFGNIAALRVAGSELPNLQILQQHCSPQRARPMGGAAVRGAGLGGRRLQHLELLGPSVAGGKDKLWELQMACGQEHLERCRSAAAGPKRTVYPNLAKLGLPEGREGLRKLQRSTSDEHWLLAARHLTGPITVPPPHRRLMLLGCPGRLPALCKLQDALGPEHVERCRGVSGGAGAGGVMQGRPASALRRRQEDVARREEQLRQREAEIAAREQQILQRSQAPPPKPRPAVCETAQTFGCLIDDDDLRGLFSTYDLDGSGYISREEFRNEYAQFEQFGLMMTEKQLDRIFAQAQTKGGDPDKLSYEEFALLMLQRARF